MFFNGMQILVNPLAMECRTVYRVQPVGIRKRRRGYRVVREEIRRPGAWKMGSTLVVHPDIFEKIKSQFGVAS